MPNRALSQAREAWPAHYRLARGRHQGFHRKRRQGQRQEIALSRGCPERRAGNFLPDYPKIVTDSQAKNINQPSFLSFSLTENQDSTRHFPLLFCLPHSAKPVSGPAEPTALPLQEYPEFLSGRIPVARPCEYPRPAVRPLPRGSCLLFKRTAPGVFSGQLQPVPLNSVAPLPCSVILFRLTIKNSVSHSIAQQRNFVQQIIMYDKSTLCITLDDITLKMKNNIFINFLYLLYTLSKEI